MKCAYHSQREAVTRCSRCDKPLCEECAPFNKEGKVVCSRCAILDAAHDASVGVDERREEREEKRLSIEAKARRKSRVLMLAVLVLTVIVLAGNFYFYLKVKAPAVKEFDPYEEMVITADLINEALMDYAGDHGGKFPERLLDIPAKYMPSEKITPSVLERFSYTRLSPESYELRVKDPKGEWDSQIIFTEEDS
ncbi:MAG: B-box zinc finger protein [Deltaproteobacteria bacterium]|nr:B-box zinc finger protein [Deltaproteobacteria bacterium]